MPQVGDVLTWRVPPEGEPAVEWKAPSGGAPSQGSCDISQSATPQALNVSSEGTEDWICLAGSSQVPRGATSSALHAKALGRGAELSFEWLMRSGVLGTFSGGLPAVSSDADDDVAPAALSGLTTQPFVYVSGGSTATGHGFRLRSPADRSARILRVYCGCWSAKIVLTARASDGSFADATATLDSGAAKEATSVFVIEYQTATDGQEIAVTVAITENHGEGNVSFAAATLAKVPP